MKAMILAAGRGERMRPLTDHTPKPLLKAGGKPLIVWTIERLAAAGFTDLVINIAHLGDQILAALGDGSTWGTRITYSDECQEGALESAGGIIKALPLLGHEPFLVVNADVWTQYPFNPHFDLNEREAHLIMVDNPQHHPHGDFALEGLELIGDGITKLTFSGIGYYDPRFFEGLDYGKRALGPLLRSKMVSGKVTGEHYQGEWRDIGTPERLAQLNKEMA